MSISLLFRTHFICCLSQTLDITVLESWLQAEFINLSAKVAIKLFMYADNNLVPSSKGHAAITYRDAG